MVQVIPQDSLSGGLARGFAEGVGEMAKGLERRFLSQGLAKLGEESENLTPFQQAARLAGIPGLTPENIPQFLDLLRRQNAFKGLKGARKGAGATGGLPQPGEATGGPEYLVPLDENQLNQKAAELYAQNPNRFTDPQDYLNEARSLDAARVGRDQAKESKIAAINQASQQAEQTIFQNEKAYSRVPSEIINSVQQKYINRPGMTPQQAGQAANNEILEYAKDLNKMKTSASSWFFNKGFESRIKDARRDREKFAKNGFAQQFDDEASASLGVDSPTAAGFLDPLRDALTKLIPGKKFLQSPGFKPFAPVTYQMPEKAMEKLANSITKEDNILSIYDSLRRKKYDMNQFQSYLDSRPDITKNFTGEQKEQYKRPLSQNRGLGDILFSTFGGR